MGTASSGGSGGGSGIRVGGGGAGGYVSSGGRMKSSPYKPSEISNEIRVILTELFGRASTYMREMFDNQYVDDVYMELFKFSSLLRDNDFVKLIGERYNLDMDEPDFIFNLVDAFDVAMRSSDISSECANTTRQTLVSFFVRAVPEDLSFGSGKDVVEAIAKNNEFWQSLSGNFLSSLAITVYEKEIEKKIPSATMEAAKEIERLTNRVISSFEKINRNTKPDYKELLRYIGQNWNWFKNEMKK